MITFSFPSHLTYGVLYNDKQRNEHTVLHNMEDTQLFPLLSITKVYTSHLLLILEQNQVLSLDTPVINYFPEHKCESIEVCSLITIRDLLCHCSGLTNDQSLMLLYPENNTFDVSDWITFLFDSSKRFFRNGFHYTDLSYAILGEIIKRQTEHSYEEEIQSSILSPLGMKYTCFDSSQCNIAGNVYIPNEKKYIPFYKQNKNINNSCNGLFSCLKDIRLWIEEHLNPTLLIQINSQNMYTPQSILSHPSQSPFYTLFTSVYSLCYGRGLFIGWFHHMKVVYHLGGGDLGFTCVLMIVPSTKHYWFSVINQEDQIQNTTEAIRQWLHSLL